MIWVSYWWRYSLEHNMTDIQNAWNYFSEGLPQLNIFFSFKHKPRNIMWSIITFNLTPFSGEKNKHGEIPDHCSISPQKKHKEIKFYILPHVHNSVSGSREQTALVTIPERAQCGPHVKRFIKLSSMLTFYQKDYLVQRVWDSIILKSQIIQRTQFWYAII